MSNRFHKERSSPTAGYKYSIGFRIEITFIATTEHKGLRASKLMRAEEKTDMS